MAETLYAQIQKRFGRLNENPISRLVVQLDMARRILDFGLEVKGKKFLEVGTGHLAIVPMGFFFMGAESVTTVDLNRRLDLGLSRKMFKWISNHRAIVQQLYSPYVSHSDLQERLDMVQHGTENPLEFFKESRISYLAPADASATGLEAKSFDYHISVTTLEHILPEVVCAVLVEARRLLNRSGLAIHIVDPSDHFQHTDHSITTINFLKFEESEWQALACNRFAYCNRLRASDYEEIFEVSDFETVRIEKEIDREALSALEAGFAVARPFRKYENQDLAVKTLIVALRPRQP